MAPIPMARYLPGSIARACTTRLRSPRPRGVRVLDSFITSTGFRCRAAISAATVPLAHHYDAARDREEHEENSIHRCSPLVLMFSTPTLCYSDISRPIARAFYRSYRYTRISQDARYAEIGREQVVAQRNSEYHANTSVAMTALITGTAHYDCHIGRNAREFGARGGTHLLTRATFVLVTLSYARIIPDSFVRAVSPIVQRSRTASDLS